MQRERPVVGARFRERHVPSRQSDKRTRGFTEPGMRAYSASMMRCLQSLIPAALVLISCATAAVEEETRPQMAPTIDVLRERLSGCCHDVSVSYDPHLTVTATAHTSASDELDAACGLVASEAEQIYGHPYGHPVEAHVRTPDGRGCIFIIAEDLASPRMIERTPQEFPAELCTGDCGEALPGGER